MAVTAQRAGCRFCQPEHPVTDPSAAELHETCDACLHDRQDEAIWDEAYVLLLHLWLSRRYVLLRGQLPSAALNANIRDCIRNIGENPDDVTMEV